MVWLVCAPGTPTRLKEHGEQETDPGERPNPNLQGQAAQDQGLLQRDFRGQPAGREVPATSKGWVQFTLI